MDTTSDQTPEIQATKATAKAKPRATKKPAAATAAAATATAAKKPAARSKAATKKITPLNKTVKKATRESRVAASSALQLTRDASLKLIDSQRAIWLAGLGALAEANTTAGEKGEQFFERLIKAGQTLEAQAHRAIETNTNRLKHGIEGATDALDQQIGRVGSAIDTLVEQALERLGFPKGTAMQELIDRLTDITKNLESKVRNTLNS